MTVPLRVLVLEDRPADAELILRELRRAGFAPEWQRVETEAEYLAGLDPALDLILADYSLPQFGALQALELVRARGLDIPFIIVSGMIGEDSAVAAMQRGADDYLLKDRLARLGSAVQHALEQRQMRIEKQHVEAALLANARLNQAVLRALTAEIAVLDPAGTIVATNDAWVQFARDHGDALMSTTGIGANYLDVCRRAADRSNDQEAAIVLAGLQAILDGQRTQFMLEYTCQTPVGQLWFLMLVTPLVGHGGAVVAHEDITGRKQAELALAERVRLAALTADVGVALTRSDTLPSILQSCAAAIVTHLDAAFARIWTLDEQEQMLELQASAGMYTDLDRLHRRIPVGSFTIGQIAQERQPHLTNNIIGELYLSDQEWLKHEGIIAFAGHPLIVGDRLMGVMALFARNPIMPSRLNALAPVANAIALGIERKRSEEALRHNYNLLQTVIESTADAIYVKDLQGRYLMINSAGARLIGKQVEEILGRDDSMLFTIDTPQILERDSLLIANGEILMYEETEPAGTGTRTYLLTKAPYHDYHGAIIGLIVISRDITEHKRLQAQYLQAQKMESVGRLAGGVAHDFNNLLTAIIGYSELALGALPPESPACADLKEILSAAKRATDLTRQLLAFARKQIVEPRVLNLNDLIDNIDKLLRRLIGEDIELITQLDPRLGHICADAGQIEQMLVNLVVNARDAMPDGGQVVIETTQAMLDAENTSQREGILVGHYVVLSVSDTGTGMTEAVRAQIFEPFFTTKEQGRGTGLGLATCYGIVKQNGGTIEVDSEIDHGTTFSVYLPYVEAAAAAPALPIHDQQTTTDLLIGTEVILLVEDEELVRAVTSRALRAQGYTVIEATDGYAALDMVESQINLKLDLLLTDMVMPKIDGKTLADLITRVRPEIKVLFISGYTDNALLQRGWAAPDFELLQKPFSPHSLARKVRSVLDAS